MLANKWIPHNPHPKQARFLTDERPEVLFGGAAGGGKSDAMLMAALMYVDVPGYSALILRRTYPQLSQEGGLIPRSHEWLSGTDAKWSERDKAWTFPSGAVVAFGHMAYETTKYDYQSGEYQFIGFEELTQFTETQYRYMHSRTRRLMESTVPIRMRATSNPGGIGHEWVRAHFVDADITPDKGFVPSGLDDNPSLDRETYERSLANLDPITRAQLLRGDWTVRAAGGMFRREWFTLVEAAPFGPRVRYWDLAATEAKPGKDPDWTVGALLAYVDGRTYICDMRRARLDPGGVERLVRSTAESDGVEVPVWIEQEPGSSGKLAIDYYQRHVLPEYSLKPDRVTGDKATRAAPLSSQAEAGNVSLVRGGWIPDFLDEAETFPDGSHDDQVDAVSGAYGKLATRSPVTQLPTSQRYGGGHGEARAHTYGVGRAARRR